MSTEQPDLFEGRAARDEALERVAMNSGAWMDSALAMIAYLPAGIEMTGEAIRVYLRERGLPPPHHHNVWGALIASAIKRQLLAETGRYGQMRMKRSHARKTPLYRRAA